MERRRFAVLGLGSFGLHLARTLHEMGHEVLALDQSRAALEAVEGRCARAVLADAADKAELEAAGVASADVAVVALGPRIDASTLATLFLRELGIREVITKALGLDHGRLLDRIGATEVIYPEREVARQLAHRLADPEVLDDLPFLEGYSLLELRAPEDLWGKTLAEAHLRRVHKMAVALIKRRERDREVSVPARPTERFRPGDVLVVLARDEDLAAFRQAHGGVA